MSHIKLYFITFHHIVLTFIFIYSSIMFQSYCEATFYHKVKFSLLKSCKVTFPHESHDIHTLRLFLYVKLIWYFKYDEFTFRSLVKTEHF